MGVCVGCIVLCLLVVGALCEGREGALGVHPALVFESVGERGPFSVTVPAGVSAAAAHAVAREHSPNEAVFSRNLAELRGGALLLGRSFSEKRIAIAQAVLRETGELLQSGDTTGVPLRSVFLGRVAEEFVARLQEEEQWGVGGGRVVQACESGFYRGMGSLRLLLASPWLHVTSFDPDQRQSLDVAARTLQSFFPGRLSLVREPTSQALLRSVGRGGCEVMFVDGEHSREGVLADLQAMQAAANCSSHVVVMDDMASEAKEAWNEFVQRGLAVTDLILGPSGVPSGAIEFTFGAAGPHLANAIKDAQYTEMVAGHFVC